MKNCERKCKIDGCNRIYDTCGFCAHHYHKWRKYGDPLTVKPAGGPRKPRCKKECLTCGKEFEFFPSRNTERKKFCSRACLNKSIKGAPFVPFDKREWYEPKKNGYLGKVFKGKMVWQHRFVMEEILGRPLLESEVVHHINGIKNDNRPDNLIVYDRSEHGRKHKDIFNELLNLRKQLEKKHSQTC